MPSVGLVRFGLLYIASPQQCDLRIPGAPLGQAAGGGARTHDRRVPADLRANSLSTVPPKSFSEDICTITSMLESETSIPISSDKNTVKVF
ncbi:hypothetical protein PoB_002455200 [Plakobranchus ocellatus]|uniref:Uncharacterized protein n=1 Tax=Plakobranchus ocellatus TaxID=259542 RepID=A0AAV3ZU27_9GAST|nr:hypothetical protein PoB_002455200 [Plakobranchus ocellatus]